MGNHSKVKSTSFKYFNFPGACKLQFECSCICCYWLCGPRLSREGCKPPSIDFCWNHNNKRRSLWPVRLRCFCPLVWLSFCPYWPHDSRHRFTLQRALESSSLDILILKSNSQVVKWDITSRFIPGSQAELSFDEFPLANHSVSSVKVLAHSVNMICWFKRTPSKTPPNSSLNKC